MRRGLNYPVKCKVCNKEFLVGKYRQILAKYCSMKCYGLSKIGHTPWNKNKPYSAIKGNKHWHWIKDRTKVKGYWNERNNPEYKQWRMKILERDNYRCFDCGEIKKGEMEADHIYSWKQYPRLRYEIDNGQTLCNNCHKIKTRNSLVIAR